MAFVNSTMPKLHVLLISLFTATAVSGQFSQEQFHLFHSLSGIWEAKSDRGLYLEVWRQVNDTLFTARSYTVTLRDTVPQEEVEIRYSTGAISYIPTVYNQNEGKPVVFRLSAIEKNEGITTVFLFANKEHDFPQEIRYQLSGNTLTVRISGNADGKYREASFHFIRK